MRLLWQRLTLNGTSAFTANLSITTDQVAAPAVPTGLAEVSKTDTTISVSWNAVTGADSYTLRLNDTTVSGVR